MKLSPLAQTFRDAFAGYGRAIRMEHEPPIPGEPMMSMEDAANAAAKTHEKLLAQPSSSMALAFLKDIYESYRHYDFIEIDRSVPGLPKRDWLGRVRICEATGAELEWAGTIAVRVIHSTLRQIIDLLQERELVAFPTGRTKEQQAEQFVQEFYVSDFYDPLAENRDTTKAAIAFTLRRLEEMREVK